MEPLEPLSHLDVKALSKSIQEIYACLDVDALPSHLLLTLQKIIPFEITSYDEINFQEGTGMYALIPSEIYTAKNTEIFERYMHEHPCLIYFIETHARTKALQPVKASDLISKTRFQRTGLYNTFYRPLGIEHQIGIEMIKTPHLSTGIALKRGGSDFSERDRLLFSLLRPHLIQVYKNAKRFRAVQNGLCQGDGEAINFALIPLEGSAPHTPLEDRIASLFGHYFENGSAKGNGASSKVRGWVRSQPPPFQDGNGTLPRSPFVIERKGKCLVLPLVIDGLRRRCFLSFKEYLIDEAYPIESAPALLERLGLTKRESEVLLCIAKGKTNLETADFLGIRPRTVEKHLEQIYIKLGVENRTAAAARALVALGRVES